jgi:hypothetical protein
MGIPFFGFARTAPNGAAGIEMVLLAATKKHSLLRCDVFTTERFSARGNEDPKYH